jgi:hypothetical protein
MTSSSVIALSRAKLRGHRDQLPHKGQGFNTATLHLCQTRCLCSKVGHHVGLDYVAEVRSSRPGK